MSEAAGSGEAAAPVVLALVAARNEAERVGATVTALRSLPEVAEVLVVSDGSTDATAAAALGAGAHCLALPRNVGKGGALNAGLAALMGRVAERVSPEPVALLLADGDLGASAARLDRVLAPVLAGEADVAIADLPPQQGAGGFGLAMGLARQGMARVTGRRMSEPLSGQRAVRWEALPALLPFAPGFGVEVAMTMDALRAGLRVVEVEADLRHAATGKDLAGLLHRGRQAGAIARELARRRAWRPAAPARAAPAPDAVAEPAPPPDAAPGARGPAAAAPPEAATRLDAPGTGRPDPAAAAPPAASPGAPGTREPARPVAGQAPPADPGER